MPVSQVSSPKPYLILVADDDADDRMLIGDAFQQSGTKVEVRFVSNGVEISEYLLRQGIYREEINSPRPDLIFLDLNMPKKDGREVLRDIRGNPELKGIPVIVLTTSRTEEDIQGLYDLGANSYIAKPVSFESLLGIAKTVGHYWFEIVKLPRFDPSQLEIARRG